MRIVAIAALGVGLSACTSVQVQYAKPAGFNSADVGEQAKLGLAYYTLQKIHVSVEPKEDAPANASAAGAGQTGNQAGGQTGTQRGTQEAGGATTPNAAQGSSEPQKHNQAASKATGGSSTSDQSAKAQASTAEKEGGGKDKKDTAAGEKPEADATDAAAVSTPVAVIDGKIWAAKLTTLPDTEHGFLMGGVHGFWKKTSVSATRLANTEQAQAVTVKAENLTAKRLGQVATVLGYFISPKKSGVTDGTAEAGGGEPKQKEPLKPFNFDVVPTTFGKKNGQDGSTWSWTLEGNPDLAGSVTFETFITGASAEGKKVNYFPVPACISAKVVVRDGEDVKATFPLIVASADRLRLQPLPLDGKLTLSAICSATVEGDAQGDKADEVFSNLAALQAAYDQVKNGPKDSDQASTAGDGSGGDAASGADDEKTKKPAADNKKPAPTGGEVGQSGGGL